MARRDGQSRGLPNGVFLLMVLGTGFVLYAYGTPHARTSYQCRESVPGSGSSHGCAYFQRCTYWGWTGYRDYYPERGNDTDCPPVKLFSFKVPPREPPARHQYLELPAQ